MRYLWLLTLPLLLAQTGCDTSFPNEEMDIAGEAKTRPFAIVCEPPEAAPGETVDAILLYYEPEPDRHDVTWKVALDYDLGLYEADEVERDYVVPEILGPPECDEHGFCTQWVSFQVPDNTLLRASSQPDEITDEIVLAVARPLLDKGEAEPVLKTEIDAFLDELAANPDWVMTVDAETAWAIRWLSDLFACRIRYRATIDGSVLVDVTKNLTVRYSHEIGTGNVNWEPYVDRPVVRTVPYPDVPFEDFDEYNDEIVNFPLALADSPGGPAEIPLHRDWTYFLSTNVDLQAYLSPYELESRQEAYRIHWYYYDLTQPASSHALFAQDDGGEAEMWDLDKDVRLMPPAAAGHTYRILVIARDERMEWENYAYASGTAGQMGEFVFVDP